MSAWITCPDCGWDYRVHGDYHKGRNCPRGRSSRRTNADVWYEPYEATHTSTIPVKDANRQQEEIKRIMARTGCTFAQAGNKYIKRGKHETRRTGEKAGGSTSQHGLRDGTLPTDRG